MSFTHLSGTVPEGTLWIFPCGDGIRSTSEPGQQDSLKEHVASDASFAHLPRYL
jgi:hypothetical protein